MAKKGEDKRTEDLLVALLAVLAEQGLTTLRTNDRLFHDAFAAALDEFRGASNTLKTLARRFHRDIVTDTYNELDHALIRAEKDGLVTFPNPSYSRFQIVMPPRVARRFVSDWAEDRKWFERAAKRFTEVYDRASV